MFSLELFKYPDMLTSRVAESVSTFEHICFYKSHLTIIAFIVAFIILFLSLRDVIFNSTKPRKLYQDD